MPAGHPSSSVCKIGENEAVLIAAVYNDGSETNASRCNVNPIDLIATSEDSLLQKRQACRAINCSYFILEDMCGPTMLLNTSKEDVPLELLLEKYGRFTPTDSRKVHLHRPGQGDKFIIQMTKNLSASYYGNGSVWTRAEVGPVLREEGLGNGMNIYLTRHLQY